MKKSLFLILTVVFFFAVNTNEVFACSCLPASEVKEEIKTASAVFSGKVTGISKHKNALRIRIRVEKTWKGSLPKTITLVTALDSAMCGYSFKIGTKYLVYAGGDNKNKLSVSLCSRTAELSKASEDIKVLGELKNKKISKD